MKFYEDILNKSKKVDELFEKSSEHELTNFKLSFLVPKVHPRFKEISKYSYCSMHLEELPKSKVYNLAKERDLLLTNM